MKEVTEQIKMDRTSSTKTGCMLRRDKIMHRAGMLDYQQLT